MKKDSQYIDAKSTFQPSNDLDEIREHTVEELTLIKSQLLSNEDTLLTDYFTARQAIEQEKLSMIDEIKALKKKNSKKV